MSNIREYEERQPKLAQEESPAQLRFDNQIAPLMHQWVFDVVKWMDFLLCWRTEFEEGLKNARERLSHLENILETERANLDKHEAHKTQVLQEIESLES